MPPWDVRSSTLPRHAHVICAGFAICHALVFFIRAIRHDLQFLGLCLEASGFVAA